MFQEGLLRPPANMAGVYAIIGLLGVFLFAVLLMIVSVVMNTAARRVADDMESIRAAGTATRRSVTGCDIARSAVVTGAGLRSHEAVWSRRRFGDIETDFVLSRRAIIFGTADGELMAVGRRAGKILWRRRFGQAFSAAPAIHGACVHVALADGELLAITVDGGFEEWRVKTPSPACSIVPLGENLYVVTAADGVEVYELSSGKRVETFHVDAKCAGEAALASGILIVCTEKGDLLGLDVEDGRKRWTAPLGAAKLGRPCVRGGWVFIADEGGSLSAISLRDGRVLWSGDLPKTSAPLACDGDRVLALTDGGELCALDAVRGERLWLAEAMGASRAGPVIHGEYACCGSVSGSVLGFDLASGSPIWQEPAANGQTTALTLLDGFLFTGTSDGVVAVIGR